MRIGLVTLFPELFEPFLNTSFVKRAIDGGQLTVHREWLRDHGIGRHRNVDDTPYGGGSGMVLRVDCVVAAIEAAEVALGGRSERILMSPQGVPLSQSAAHGLAEEERPITLICGRYEGFDERVRLEVDREISLGDFVLTGGEVPAMALIEAAVRLVPGVLGNHDSVREESFSIAGEGGLEYPHYTRPSVFRDRPVPDVLKSGDHGKIAAWRDAQGRQRTAERRPDLNEDENKDV